MIAPIQYKLNGRGVTIPAFMTSEDKIKIVKSIYSNKNTYAIAAYIYAHKNCSNGDIIQATGMNKTSVSLMLSNMQSCGVIIVNSDSKDGRENVISMTELGKKLMRIL